MHPREENLAQSSIPRQGKQMFAAKRFDFQLEILFLSKNSGCPNVCLLIEYFSHRVSYEVP